MVVSEIVAATMIAVCGLKRSYRIVLKGERMIRRRVRKPAPIIDGYQSLPRSFFRTVFRAGYVIAMRWEGRAQNAAQRARAAKLKAYEARARVADISSDVRARAGELREKAEDVRKRARQSATEMRAHAQDRAAAARSRMQEARDQWSAAKTRASAIAARFRETVPESGRREGTSKGLPELLDESGSTQKNGKGDEDKVSQNNPSAENAALSKNSRPAMLDEEDLTDSSAPKKSHSIQNRM